MTDAEWAIVEPLLPAPRAGLAALEGLDPTLPRYSAAAAYLHERDGDPAQLGVEPRGLSCEVVAFGEVGRRPGSFGVEPRCGSTAGRGGNPRSIAASDSARVRLSGQRALAR
ncbi:hypothetical protein SIM91_33710 [Rhodococcus opacus]|uniref:hypothetical protein n=1 Tax=Rhodococcus opacus TaxID=37919 RepID=UPI002265277F|nr:hypothetical protein [Rhodococcus opacus]MDX5968163.1 hypothetical protein [Rhodococcus opacus]